jgi:hypothetical protein
MDVTIKGNYIGFDEEKHVNFLRRIIDWITKGNELVLDFSEAAARQAMPFIKEMPNLVVQIDSSLFKSLNPLKGRTTGTWRT